MLPKKWGGECQLNERPNYEKQKFKILEKKEKIYIYDKIRLGRERFLKKNTINRNHKGNRLTNFDYTQIKNSCASENTIKK